MIFRIFLFTTCLLSIQTNAFADNDELLNQIELEQIQARADLVERSALAAINEIESFSKSLKQNNEPKISANEYLEFIRYSSDQAETIADDAESLQIRTVNLIQNAKTKLGFGTKQPNEKQSKSEILFGVISRMDCVTLSVRLANRFFSTGGIHFGREIISTCKKLADTTTQ